MIIPGRARFSTRSVSILMMAAALCISPSALAQQIDIPRVEAMPNLPQPYEMRDWRAVALAYDSLVFDVNQAGDYLPLVWINRNTVNYPEHPSFGLHTVVGTPYPESAEAINALPALVGATLAGADKTDQYGRNWVLMAEEWFNRRPAEDVYLNHPVTTSGGDWWYDTMPNVFFYQLYDLHPDADRFGAHFDEQFSAVADRWLAAVAAMGGSAAPWTSPEMTYRGWHLSSMTPNTQNPPEPESAGAIAWLLYHAFVETGEMQYRQGAEWAMEYLNGLSSNPSYELQLPYGAYAAARMNAELRTDYDVEKIINWTFDVGPIRNWGVILGTWGIYDVHGLVGEAGSNGYAFAMNTFEQAGALVPLVRYDDRFARAVGKWMLNAANAARLFYTEFLPDSLQDSDAWAREFDPRSVIAHEALRQFKFNRSPYATGDAIDGGWGATNLALYGSSHAGIFGGMIDTTAVPGILRLDARKTDFFQSDAHPTYLIYNPYAEVRTVEVPFEQGTYAVYDAVTNTYLVQAATGAASIQIPPDEAVLAVIIPQNATVIYEDGKMFADGVVVDYRSAQPADHPLPRVKGLGVDPGTVQPGSENRLYCTAEHAEEYEWHVEGGRLVGGGEAVVEWVAPDLEGSVGITCVVRGLQGEEASERMEVDVIASAPVITAVTADPRKVDLGGMSALTCTAEDPTGLTFSWEADAGSFSGSGPAVTWQAPWYEIDVEVRCRAESEGGAAAEASAAVVVRDFTAGGAGDLVAFYPLDGSADDASGFGHHGAVAGAVPSANREGAPSSAYRFDGENDAIRIPNSVRLNFRDGITVAFWMRADQMFEREAYPISHGNWERRWKVSVTDERVRWTIKTDQGVKDVDSETTIRTGVWYHVVVRYDGSDVEIYLDGALDAIDAHGGRLLATGVDLTLGQVLPDNDQYNFAGVLDDVRIFDYPLSTNALLALYAEAVPVDRPASLPAAAAIHPPYPNPFTATTTLRYETPTSGRVTIHIYNLLGQRIAILTDAEQPAGVHAVRWDGRTDGGSPAASGIYLIELRAGDASVRRPLVLVR